MTKRIIEDKNTVLENEDLLLKIGSHLGMEIILCRRVNKKFQNVFGDFHTIASNNPFLRSALEEKIYQQIKKKFEIEEKDMIVLSSSQLNSFIRLSVMVPEIDKNAAGWVQYCAFPLVILCLSLASFMGPPSISTLVSSGLSLLIYLCTHAISNASYINIILGDKLKWHIDFINHGLRRLYSQPPIFLLENKTFPIIKKDNLCENQKKHPLRNFVLFAALLIFFLPALLMGNPSGALFDCIAISVLFLGTTGIDFHIDREITSKTNRINENAENVWRFISTHATVHIQPPTEAKENVRDELQAPLLSLSIEP